MVNQLNKQISHPPTEFEWVDKNRKLTTQALDWHNSIKPTLENCITNYSISTPIVAQTQRDSIAKVANGMDIYNNDLNKRQVQENGAWKTYSTSYTNLAGETPQITTVQRDGIAGTLNGSIIYNTDLHTPQMYVNGAWKTFTLT